MNLKRAAVLLIFLTSITSLAQQNEVIKLLQESAALIQDGKFGDAEPLLRNSVRTSPENPDAHNLLGIVLDQLGKPAEAEREYRTAIRLNPKSISPRANLGILLAKGKRQAEAVPLGAPRLREPQRDHHRNTDALNRSGIRHRLSLHDRSRTGLCDGPTRAA